MVDGSMSTTAPGGLPGATLPLRSTNGVVPCSTSRPGGLYPPGVLAASIAAFADSPWRCTSAGSLEMSGFCGEGSGGNHQRLAKGE